MAASKTVTTAGRGWFAQVLTNAVATPTYYFACGTGSAAAAEADVALAAESACPRVAVTPTITTNTILDFLAQWANTTGASIDVIELGLWSAASGGTLLQRCVLAAAVPVPASMNFACHTTIPLSAVVV
jgi:hypothetical protein